jgi:predicted porin
MRKQFSLLVIAGCASSTLALAQTHVTIYGNLNADLENVKADGGAVDIPSRNRVSSNISYIGFRGTEDLGGKLKAIWQIESSAVISGDPAPPGTFASRNSNVGLAHSDFGIIFYGNWLSPYKNMAIQLDPFFNTGIPAVNSIIGNGFVTGANRSNPQSFDRRVNNVVQYWTPKWAGFSARLAYGANEERAGNIDPSLWAGSIVYENGPLYIVYAHERHDEWFADGTEDTGNKVGIGYTTGNTRLSAIFERLEYEPTAATELRRDAWALAATHTVGPHIFRILYIRAEESEGDANVTIGGVGPADTDSGARQISLGYGYTLSKRTELYAFYVTLTNDDTALYNFSTNPLGGLTADSDLRGFGLGIRHTF